MIRLLDKEQETDLLPRLFEILYENMQDITPFRYSFEEEKEQWLSCVTPALKKAPRQIALMYAGNELAGFCMYYVNDGRFMVEEVQIRKKFRQTGLIVELYRFFRRILPMEVQVIEAYADRRNGYSQRLIRKLGMEAVGESKDGTCIHFYGEIYHLLKK